MAGRAPARRRSRDSATSFEPATAALPSCRSSTTSTTRTRALDEVARALAAEGALSAWRDERYAVVDAFGAPPVVRARACRGALFRHPHVRRARQRSRPRRRRRRDVVRASQSGQGDRSRPARQPRRRRHRRGQHGRRDGGQGSLGGSGHRPGNGRAGRAVRDRADLPPAARRPAARDDLRARPVARAPRSSRRTTTARSSSTAASISPPRRGSSPTRPARTSSPPTRASSCSIACCGTARSRRTAPDWPALDALRRPDCEVLGLSARQAAARALATGAICRIPSSASVSRTALTAWRISSGPIAPMQPTRNVSTCVSLPG